MLRSPPPHTNTPHPLFFFSHTPSLSISLNFSSSYQKDFPLKNEKNLLRAKQKKKSLKIISPDFQCFNPKKEKKSKDILLSQKKYKKNANPI